MSCGQACDGCNERAQHHLCPACANEDIDNLKKELREARVERDEAFRERADWMHSLDRATADIAKLMKERDEARAEVERLREMVRKVHALSGAMSNWPDVIDLKECGSKIHKLTKEKAEP